MYRKLSVAGALLCSIITMAHGATVLSFQFKVPASTQPTVVEATTNLLNWVAIQTNAPSATPIAITDPQSPNYSRRFYRWRNLSAALPDLALLTNSVFMASEGFNSLQYAPNGKLGFIVWRGQDLVYRERNGTVWTEKVIGPFGNTYVPGARDEYRFQPHAALLFDSQSLAHILRLSGSTIVHHIQQTNANFTTTTSISLASVGSSFSLFAAGIGAGEKLHIALVGSSSGAAITYGSNKTGSWQWNTVTNVTGDPRGFFRQSYAPRWFSMVVDSQNYAHITFCPEFALPIGPEGYLRPYDTLFYASNRSGSWTTQKIADVADLSGDAGQGASIAIGPNDQPAVAAWYNERVSTGSSEFCQLHYYSRDVNGNWSKQIVATAPAGYVAGDGDKGTGFAPYLRFDSLGRPNIAFTDDAAQHFPTSGQNEYAGNLRYACFNGTSWNIRTLYTQTTALDRQIVYPAMAISGNEVSFMGLDRGTVWVQPDYRVATSTYNYFFVQTTLP